MGCARVVLLCLLALASSGAAAGAGDVHFERMGNGLELHLERVPGSTELALFLFVKNGWAHDPLDGTGTMHLLEHLVMTGATPERKGWSYARWVRERSAANAMTTCRYTCYFSIGGRKDVSGDARRWAEVLSGQLRFGVRDLGRERPRAWMEARNVTTLLPGPMLQWRGRQRVLAGSPEGRVGVGLQEPLAKVGEDALRDAYLRSHHVGNALIVAVGHVDPEKDLPFYREVFGGLAPSEREPLPVPTPESSLEHAPAAWSVMQVRGPFATLAFAAPPRGDGDFAAFAVAAAVLGRRAMLSFPRGKTLEQAMFFPGYYALLELPELAFFNWRGEDGAKLDQAQEKLLAWMEQQRPRAIGSNELKFAQRQLLQLLDPLPRNRQRAAQLARFPRLLYPVGVSRGLTRMGLLPEGLGGQIAALDTKSVAAAVQKHFARERGELLGLRPKLPELEEEMRRKAAEEGK